MESCFQFLASFFSYRFTTVADSFCKIYHLTFMFQLGPIIFDFYYSSTWYLLANFWFCLKCILFILLLLLSARFTLQLLSFLLNFVIYYFYNSLCEIPLSILIFSPKRTFSISYNSQWENRNSTFMFCTNLIILPLLWCYPQYLPPGFDILSQSHHFTFVYTVPTRSSFWFLFSAKIVPINISINPSVRFPF